MRVSSDVQDYAAMVPESQLLSSELEALLLRQLRSCCGWANNARVRDKVSKDDTVETVNTRLSKYHAETAPIVP